MCCQAMDLSDNDFQYFYRETLKYIGIPYEEVEESMTIWMLNKIDDKILPIINEGAIGFR